MSSDLVDGTCAARFDPLRLAFAANLASGVDVGASVCVTVEGETVVDLWGGYRDAARTMPWQRDTLVCVYSCTKAMSALTALWLADQGRLDVDAPVAAYWPEFAQNGKDEVLVRQVLNHSAGLPEWATPIGLADLYDWHHATRLLAEQRPAWPPGSAFGYHSLTQGYLIGEIVRRIDGRSIGQVFHEEIARPLRADFYIGLPAVLDDRVAELVTPAPWPPPDSVGSGVSLDVALTRTRAWRAAEVPAGGGIGHARAMAEVLAVLANEGRVAGRQLLQPQTCRRALEVDVEGVDRVLGTPLRFGLGLAVGGAMPNPDTLYWAGHGGSLVIIDMNARTTFAYAMNRMSPAISGDARGFGLAMAMWEACGLI